eukprot:TRINITY_DN30426_c0_g1_i1.p3 TRINITY_DN30426_c0_g1~~TRINITY_DN30426_c0_g1_i1.p3  ORF type:complete len:128 (-),score=12.79 TRINITY_DN30426_c0_g1_i1:574-957(-)
MDRGVVVMVPGRSSGAEQAATNHAAPKRVFFSRRELDQILGLYGRMVAAGEWRDYAMADGAEVAVFAVHRRTSEQPLYRIEKRPALARKQGAFAVIAAGGRVMKRGADLANVLAVLERKLLKIVEGE